MRIVRTASGVACLTLVVATAASCGSSKSDAPTYASVDVSELDNALAGSPSAAVKAVNAALLAQMSNTELLTIEMQWRLDPLSPEDGDLVTNAAFMKALRITAQTLDSIGYHAPATPDAAFVAPASMKPSATPKTRMTCTGDTVCTDMMNALQTVNYNVASRFAKDGKHDCYGYDTHGACIASILVICDGTIFNRGPGTYVGTMNELDTCATTGCKPASSSGGDAGTDSGSGTCISSVCSDPSPGKCPSGRADLGCSCYDTPPMVSSSVTLLSKCVPAGSNVSGGPYCCAKVDSAANGGVNCQCAFVDASLDCAAFATAMSGKQVASCP